MFNLFIEKFNKIEKPKSFKNEDDLYTFAHESFSKIANEIEKEVDVHKEEYASHEEWYDEYHDEVTQVFMQILTEE